MREFPNICVSLLYQTSEAKCVSYNSKCFAHNEHIL